MKKLLKILFGTSLNVLFCILVAINFVNVIMLKNLSFTLDFSLLNYDKRVAMITYLIIIVITLFMVLNMLSGNIKKKLDDDQENFSHISSVYEAKKGLQRVQYKRIDGRWCFCENTVLSSLDYALNPMKKGINGILTFFRVDDRHKFNTITKWKIADEEHLMRAGLPVYMPRFRKKTMFLECKDVHTLINGTTFSGKSVSVILQMIEMIRMAGECAVINDPKGELYEYTAKQFEEDGYEVIRLNFVNPEASDDWGILDYAWNEWKRAYKIYEEELKDWNTEGKNLSAKEKALWLSRKPEPDYSVAIEYLTDMANILTYEKNANDQFWNNSAGDVITGLLAFLMEEGTRLENISDMDPYINFKSMRMCSIIGDEPLTKEEMKLLQVKNKFVLPAYLELSRKSDDLSIMKLKDYFEAAEGTRTSIKKVLSTKTSLLTMNEQIMRMTSKSSFNLADLGKKKMAIYLIVHDEKKTYYPLVTLFIKQLYETIINQARGNKGRLPIPVNVILDEFGNMPPLKDVQNMLTAGRSRGVRFTLAIQDISQLDDVYGKTVAQTIQNNCNSTVFVLGSQPETLKNFSAMCGNRQVWLPARQMYESRPLISVDRLQHLNLGEVVIHRQRKSPFITRMIPYYKCKFYQGKRADPNDLKPKKEKVAWLNVRELLNQQTGMY